MIRKSKSGFTLAEVLTTLMVIGVVAAMTIPTLLNSTDDQQKKVALRKAVSVLGQGVQLSVAKEVECDVTTSATLAACMAKMISGTPQKSKESATGDPTGNTDMIVTPDGMAFKFIYDGSNTTTGLSRNLVDICGKGEDVFKNTADGWSGKTAHCAVIVDVNGTGKGTKHFVAGDTLKTKLTGGVSQDSDVRAGSDQYMLIFTGDGVRPTWWSSQSMTSAYEMMYGNNLTTSDLST